MTESAPDFAAEPRTSFEEQAMAVELMFLGNLDIFERIVTGKLKRPDYEVERKRTLLKATYDGVETLKAISRKHAARAAAEDSSP